MWILTAFRQKQCQIDEATLSAMPDFIRELIIVAYESARGELQKPLKGEMQVLLQDAQKYDSRSALADGRPVGCPAGRPAGRPTRCPGMTICRIKRYRFLAEFFANLRLRFLRELIL